ncbi:IS66 family transposase [Flavobacterium sp.]|uniref:IS66 family transposase n=1 Tax=Flavobacterium sp. TaxID=239 RepID=UPI00374DD110
MQDLYDNYSKNELLKLLNGQEKVISKIESNVTKLEQENSYLKFQIEQFKRAMYGSKKERFIASENPEQLSIPFEIDEQKVTEAVKAVVEEITYQRKKAGSKNHPGRLALPSHLFVNEIILEPTENIEGLKIIGQEITDELEYSPAKLYINRYTRNKYITPEDEQGRQKVKIASLDFRPIPKCIAGPNLLAQIVVDKFVDHLPLYRQIQRFSREGVDIAPSTVDSWVKLTSQLLRPLYECHYQHTVLNGYLQVDESPIKVQDKDKKKYTFDKTSGSAVGTTHTGYMWVYHAPILKSVYFDYRKGRTQQGPQEMLNEFEGYLQTDGYGVYNQFGLKEQITHIGCWAHARRYFEKALDYNKANASHVMVLIQKLYDVERKATLLKLDPAERKSLRLEESHPILNEIGTYIALQSRIELPKSPLGRAYDYCLNRWNTLLDYLKDGNLQIDNNLIENAIRPLALGRKNYLFAGSHDAAKNIAMYYSFFATCKKNEINPLKWLSYVLKNINNTKVSEINKLLPQYIDCKLLD